MGKNMAELKDVYAQTKRRLPRSPYEGRYRSRFVFYWTPFRFMISLLLLLMVAVVTLIIYLYHIDKWDVFYPLSLIVVLMYFPLWGGLVVSSRYKVIRKLAVYVKDINLIRARGYTWQLRSIDLSSELDTYIMEQLYYRLAFHVPYTLNHLPDDSSSKAWLDLKSLMLDQLIDIINTIEFYHEFRIKGDASFALDQSIVLKSDEDIINEHIYNEIKQSKEFVDKKNT